jgi:hypothetical protein
MSIETLREARRAIKDRGVAPKESVGQDYLDLILDIKRRMNVAKVAALREAEKPFLLELQEVEEEYAMLLKLAS